MSKRDDGGSAFPLAASAQGVPGGVAYTMQQSGMSLRDWFAGQALAGLVSKYNINKPEDFQIVAETSLRFADAMLAERAKE